MLEVHGIQKSFGSQPVLKGVDLSVEKGDVVAILGPSGSGKTTLLRCINFLEQADGGTMTFDGKTYRFGHVGKKEQNAMRRKTGFVFQNYNLFRNKTALQNVTEGLIIARKMPKAQAEEIGRRALDRVGLSDRYDYYPRQLSGGQQQRVAIARAIATGPDIIFFDEPTSALDPELTGEVLSVMRQLADDGMTMLVVTHEMGFARNVSSKVVFMEDGVVVEAAPSQEFFRAPKQQRTKAFLQMIEQHGILATECPPGRATTACQDTDIQAMTGGFRNDNPYDLPHRRGGAGRRPADPDRLQHLRRRRFRRRTRPAGAHASAASDARAAASGEDGGGCGRPAGPASRPAAS